MCLVMLVLCKCWGVEGDFVMQVLECSVRFSGCVMQVGVFMVIVSHADVGVLMVICVTYRCWHADCNCVTCRCWSVDGDCWSVDGECATCRCWGVDGDCVTCKC